MTNTDASSFIILSKDEGQNAGTFTDMTVFRTSGYSELVRCKRDGKWWMLKTLKPQFRNDLNYQGLLHKEADILMNAQTDGVVVCKGLETVEGFGDCIIMEWIDGKTLTEWLRDKHKRKERQRVANELIATIERIHRKQVVHRDLKPDNIMITRNGQHVRLIDFGLADTDDSLFFKQPAGTVGYISPEQSVGNRADCRNDIYSLGKILLQMRLGLFYHLAARRCVSSMDKRWYDASSVSRSVRHMRRIATVILSALIIATGAGGVAIYYQATHKTGQIYDITSDFNVGHLRYQSWGGAGATVQTAKGCDDQDVVVPASVTYEGIKYSVRETAFYAFRGCRNLRTFAVLKKGYFAFMKGTFDGCYNLSDIVLHNPTPPRIGNAQWKVDITQVFMPRHFETVRLHVPKGTISYYRNSPWRKFKHIEEWQ